MIWAVFILTLGSGLAARPSLAQEEGGGWVIEELGVGTKPELAVDSRDRVHIAYMIEDLSGGLFHALRESDEWEITRLVSGYFYGPLDLAIDSGDRPHIAYHDHTVEDLVYAYFDGTEWTNTTIGDDGHDGWDSA